MSDVHPLVRPVPRDRHSASAGPDRCLVLFTKPARPGRVKTRLTRGTGALRPEEAARLHAAFLGDLVERLLPMTLSPEAGGAPELRLRVAWALDDRTDDAPDRQAGGRSHRGRLPDLAEEVARTGWEERPLAVPADACIDSVRQAGETLGDRLHRALTEAAATHPGGVAAIGSDHPTVPRAWVRAAFDALAVADVVLGPADDGGYYLVALGTGAVRRELFDDVPWSTGEVLAATEERCRHLGLAVAHLPPGRDVDEPRDLAALARFLAGDPTARTAPGEAADCPRTRYLLDLWGPPLR